MTQSLDPLSGRFDGSLHRYALRVFYEDTDAGGIVYHASYLRWFERARSDMLRLLGVDQAAALSRREGNYAVTDLAIRYLRPALLEDVVEVESCVTEIGGASWRLDQRALRNGELLAAAQLRLGFMTASGRATRQPAAWRAALATLVSSATPVPSESYA